MKWYADMGIETQVSGFAAADKDMPYHIANHNSKCLNQKALDAMKQFQLA